MAKANIQLISSMQIYIPSTHMNFYVKLREEVKTLSPCSPGLGWRVNLLEVNLILMLSFRVKRKKKCLLRLS